MSNRAKIVAIPTTTTTTFSPTSIAGCALWLDGADPAGTGIVPASGNLATWVDKSGGGINAIAGTSVYPQFTTSYLNGLGVVGLTNSADYFTVANNFNTSSLAYIFVMKPTSANTGGYCGILSTDTPNAYGRSIALNNMNFQFEYYSNFTNTSIAINSTTWYIISLVFNGTSSITLSYNGTISTYGGSGTGTNTNGLTIGSYNDTSSYTTFNANFYLAEAIVYTSSLTQTQFQTVESYLAQKWGLTSNLAAGHPGLTTPVYTITIAVPRQKIRTIPRAGAFTNFLPTSITGCVMWLDAADLTSMTLSGANVSQWTDKSGSGNSVTQASSGSQPTTGGTLNGLNTLYFTGKTMTYTGISVSAQTVFCIYLNNTFTPYGEPVAVGPFAFFYAAPSNNVGIGRTGVTDEVLANWSTNSLTTSKYTIYGGTVSVSGSTTSVLYFNGTQVASTTVSSSGGSVRYNIGHYASGTTGYLAEVLIYNSVLNQTNRQNVESYLAQKWALTSNLPVGHPGLTTTVYGTVAAPTVRQKISIIKSVVLVSYTQAFAYTGANQTFAVPATTTSITVYMWGAGAGGNTNHGGAGAMVQGVLSVTPGETLTIVVGQGGTIDGTTTFGGGGAGGGNMTGTPPTVGIGFSHNGFPQNAGSGGGRSAIQRGGTDPTNDIVVAGGGGGGSYFSSDRGGSATFSGTANAGVGGLPGLGGTQSAGGAGGGVGTYGTGLSGSRGVGGDTYNNNYYNGGGGGGGGYYGGGGGGTNGGDGAGGGGGSSLTSTLSLISGQSVLGFNSTNGYTAPNNTSPYYVSGVGNGAPAINSNPRAGGNGLIVLVYMG